MIGTFTQATLRSIGKHSNMIMFGVLSLGVLVVFLVRLNNIWVVYPDISGLESTSVIYYLQKYMLGLSVYTDPEAAPFAICQYTPLYYWITGFIGKVFSVNASEPIEVFRLSRTISLLFNILSLSALAVIARSLLQVKWKYLLLLLGLVFMFIEPQLFSRPDSLYQLLFVVSMGSVLKFMGKGPDTGKLKWIFVAGVLSAFALFSKQTALIVPVIVVSYLLFFSSNIRATGLYLFGYGVSFSLLLLAVGNVEVFYKNVVLGLDNGVDVLWYYKYIWSGFLPLIFPIVVVAIGVALTKLTDIELGKEHFWAFVVLVTFAFANATSLKYGSGPNYFQEFMLVAMLIIAKYLSDKDFGIAADVQQKFLPRYIMLAGIVLLVGLQSSRVVFDFRYSDAPQEYSSAKEIAGYLEDKAGTNEVFVFAKGWVEKSFVYNFLLEKAVMVNKDIYGCCSYPRGVFNVDGFKTAMTNGTIKYVILPEVWDEIIYLDESYKGFNTVFTAKPYKVCTFVEPIEID